jgi:hypothetical protein
MLANSHKIQTVLPWNPTPAISLAATASRIPNETAHGPPVGTCHASLRRGTGGEYLWLEDVKQCVRHRVNTPGRHGSPSLTASLEASGGVLVISLGWKACCIADMRRRRRAWRGCIDASTAACHVAAAAQHPQGRRGAAVRRGGAASRRSSICASPTPSVKATALSSGCTERSTGGHSSRRDTTGAYPRACDSRMQ